MRHTLWSMSICNGFASHNYVPFVRTSLFTSSFWADIIMHYATWSYEHVVLGHSVVYVTITTRERWRRVCVVIYSPVLRNLFLWSPSWFGECHTCNYNKLWTRGYVFDYVSWRIFVCYTSQRHYDERENITPSYITRYYIVML